jgi:hypothetical protein
MTIEKAIEKQERVVHYVSLIFAWRSMTQKANIIISARAQDVIRAHDRLQFLRLMQEQP